MNIGKYALSKISFGFIELNPVKSLEKNGWGNCGIVCGLKLMKFIFFIMQMQADFFSVIDSSIPCAQLEMTLKFYCWLWFCVVVMWFLFCCGFVGLFFQKGEVLIFLFCQGFFSYLDFLLC